MSKLPQRLPVDQMQVRWATILDPLLDSPLAQPVMLKSISLKSGANSVPHLLGKPLTGWIVTRIRANATIYDTQDSNQMPALTLNLVASAAVVVDLLVF